MFSNHLQLPVENFAHTQSYKLQLGVLKLTTANVTLWVGGAERANLHVSPRMNNNISW